MIMNELCRKCLYSRECKEAGAAYAELYRKGTASNSSFSYNQIDEYL